MSVLRVRDYNGLKVIDSRDVANMVERDHNGLLKSIRTYVEYLAEGDFALGSFFIESSYIDNQNQQRPCYLITKQGCDMIANKMTGKKGVLFTAAYVTAFSAMQEQLANGPTVPPSVSPSGLASLIRINRRIMLDMGCTANEVGQMARDVFKTWAIPAPEPLNRQIPGQFSIWEQGKLGEVTTCVQ